MDNVDFELETFFDLPRDWSNCEDFPDPFDHLSSQETTLDPSLLSSPQDRDSRHNSQDAFFHMDKDRQDDRSLQPEVHPGPSFPNNDSQVLMAAPTVKVFDDNNNVISDVDQQDEWNLPLDASDSWYWSSAPTEEQYDFPIPTQITEIADHTSVRSGDLSIKTKAPVPFGNEHEGSKGTSTCFTFIIYLFMPESYIALVLIAT